ncbi:MAG: SOS response-associated peptidase [Erysipelotrichaceae bacterium]|nr:SOS response-associated peptidase [Erysipelotrichaceae bacterium]
MCGKYYYSQDTYHFIDTHVDVNFSKNTNCDYQPVQKIPIILMQNNQRICKMMPWGYSIYNKKVINARSETIRERKLFQNDIIYRRCLIPAQGFYEKDKDKHTFAFESKSHQTILLAGIYNINNEVSIITTKANEVMKPIHHRMPLMIEEASMNQWLRNNQKLDYFLQIENNDLEIVSGVYQPKLF